MTLLKMLFIKIRVNLVLNIKMINVLTTMSAILVYTSVTIVRDAQIREEVMNVFALMVLSVMIKTALKGINIELVKICQVDTIISCLENLI